MSDKPDHWPTQEQIDTVKAACGEKCDYPRCCRQGHGDPDCLDRVEELGMPR